MQPAQIFMALTVRIGADQGPEIIRRQMVAHHDLLAVDDIIVTIADRFSLAIGDVATAMRLRQHLPDTDFRASDRREELSLLLFSAPPDQNRRNNARQRVEHM